MYSSNTSTSRLQILKVLRSCFRNTNLTILLGNAIKCLAKIVTRIPEKQVAEICSKLVKNLLNPQKEEVKNYEIYSTCLKTLITESTDSLADLLCRTFASAGLTQRTKFPEVNEELIEITNQLIKRFTPYLTKQTTVLDRTKLSKDLIGNIPTSLPC